MPPIGRQVTEYASRLFKNPLIKARLDLRGWKFGLTPLPSLRSKAHKMIRENLPIFDVGLHLNWPCQLPYPHQLFKYSIVRQPFIVQWFWLHSVVFRLLGSCGVRTSPQYPWLAILCDWMWQSFRWDWTNRGSVSRGSQRIYVSSRGPSFAALYQ